jgi:hypothetical protein
MAARHKRDPDMMTLEIPDCVIDCCFVLPKKVLSTDWKSVRDIEDSFRLVINDAFSTTFVF